MRLSGFNVTDTPVSTDMPQTMLLNMNGAGGDVECKLVSPSGREDDCFITPLGTPGEHSVRFVPQEEGVHYLHAKLNGIHIPGSPFKLVVSNLTNMMNNNHGDPSSTVSVHGKGIYLTNTQLGNEERNIYVTIEKLKLNHNVFVCRYKWGCNGSCFHIYY